MVTYHLHLVNANEQKMEKADLYDDSRHTQKGGKAALIGEICYAGIRLLEIFLLHPSPWWTDKISLWRNTTCSAASKELQQQQAQQKTSAGEWFHRRGWRWHKSCPGAGGSLSVKTVVAMPNIIIIPLTIYLYYCILTEYVQQSQCRKTQPLRGNVWCNHPPSALLHKQTHLGTQTMRLEGSDGNSTVMERFAYVKTAIIETQKAQQVLNRNVA